MSIIFPFLPNNTYHWTMKYDSLIEIVQCSILYLEKPSFEFQLFANEKAMNCSLSISIWEELWTKKSKKITFYWPWRRVLMLLTLIQGPTLLFSIKKPILNRKAKHRSFAEVRCRSAIWKSLCSNDLATPT